jgi:hypothetical protein
MAEELSKGDTDFGWRVLTEPYHIHVWKATGYKLISLRIDFQIFLMHGEPWESQCVCVCVCGGSDVCSGRGRP